MDKLSESYVAYILEQSFLHPIPPGDVKQVLKDLLYAFVGTGNPWRDMGAGAKAAAPATAPKKSTDLRMLTSGQYLTSRLFLRSFCLVLLL